MPHSSSRGPRRGFYWQDWYAAWMLLRCWRSPSEGIEAIEIEAADSPHIDDIIVHRSKRTTYYQLKRIQGGRLTGKALFASATGPPLIRKLLTGWRRVRATATKEVEIVLATNASLSSSPQNRPISPAAFSSQFLASLHRDPLWRPKPDEEPFWQQLLGIAGAQSHIELAAFLHSLHLVPDQPSADELRTSVIEILRGALRPSQGSQLEAEAWISRVYDLATHVGAPQSLTRDHIDVELRRLFHAPRRRLEHILALPDNHVPRKDLAQRILERAQSLREGYLLVTGPPGSGKTTLATWMADSYPEDVLLRYHVFHPRRSADIERSRRATALSFVTELLEALADRFPQTVERYAPAKETTAEAIAALWIELGRLQRKRTAIIVVDGIDHVFRASRDDGEMLFASLRRDAPSDVVFILFGQPGWPYPPWLERTSRFEVPPFTAPEISLLLTTSLPWSRGDLALPPLVDAIQERTSGNPLSLFYTLPSLETFPSAREALDALEEITIFGDKPHEEYELLLDRIENQVSYESTSFRRDLLAWLAVALAPITLERLLSSFSKDALSERAGKDVLETLRPVLTEFDSGKFRIFHDDFRRFAESGLTSSRRKAAHSRHARSLLVSFRVDEVRALSEHLWFAGLFQELASLPSSRELPEWLVDVGPEQVGDLFRLSCAATLMCGSDAQIVASCLSCKLALDASPEWYQDRVPWGYPRDLKTWSFMPPPEEIDPESLRRCAEALRVAARHVEENPALAQTVVNRFAIQETRWPTGDNLSHDFSDYLAAWSSWLLLSGRPQEVSLLLRSTKRGSGSILSAVEKLLQSKTDPEVLFGWSAGLIPAADVVARTLIKAALRHLVSGQIEATVAILRALNREPEALSIETRRDAACLSSLVNQGTILPEHAVAKVRWSRGYSGEGARWREFFFSGMVSGYLSRGKEPSQLNYPARFRDFAPQDTIESDSLVAELCWRSGVVAGIAKRSPGLVRVTDVISAARPFLEGSSDLPRHAAYNLSEAAQVYLPLLAHAVSGCRELATNFSSRLLESAQEIYLQYGSRTVGVLESLSVLSPDRWEEVAVKALSANRLPKSNLDTRYQWFSYWRSRARKKGIAIPESFDGLASICLLGVYRKTYPTSPAVELLGASLDKPDFEERLRSLVDVLIQVDQEPEADRTVLYALPRVLALALISDASLFVREFRRATFDSSIARPFDSTRGFVAETVLDLEAADLTSVELVALWHWVAASPASDQHAEEIASSIAQKLRSAGEEKFAASIEAWATAITPAHEGSTEGSPADEDSPTTERLAKKAARDLSLKEITPAWFSSYLSQEENAFLKRLLAESSENWEKICSFLAGNLADGTASAANLDSVAEAIPSLRPNLNTVEAFRAALHYVRMRARFQEEPPQRTAPAEGAPCDRPEALVRLTAEGLEAKGAEVVRRALRALATMGQHPDLCALVEEEVVTRLKSTSDRIVTFALAILRQLPNLSSTTLAEIRGHQHHRNAWCRWLACTIGEVNPEWSNPPSLSALPGPISLEPVPSKRSLGAVYFSDPTSVREIYVRRLRELTGLEEDFIRERIELEYRSLPWPQVGSKTMIPSREGPGLTEHGMGSAAARAMSGLLVGAPPPVVSPILSVAATFDPWLALAHPHQPPREGWIELAAMEERIEDRKAWQRLRVLCGVPRELWSQLSSSSSHDIASIALHLMVPREPDLYAWISEEWELPTPAIYNSGPIQPLAFLNQPFTELSRAGFHVVPRWDLPIGAALSFDNHERPRWIDKNGEVMIEAFYQEWKGVRPGVSESPSWRAGWFISPAWLRHAFEPIAKTTTLVSCSRVATGARTDDASDEEEQVSFFAEEVDLQLGRRAPKR